MITLKIFIYNMSFKSRLLARLPALRSLSLAGSPAEAALALRSSTCPPLTALDLSFARCLDDAKLRGILAPPENSRPGGGARSGTEPSRLAALAVLRLPGTDITDVAMLYIVQVKNKNALYIIKYRYIYSHLLGDTIIQFLIYNL